MWLTKREYHVAHKVFQTFLIENSHLPLKQVNAFMNFSCENIQDPPPPKFKVIKIYFGHMIATCTPPRPKCVQGKSV